jgi:glycosyltransferase involved in cell wall biosynthesis
MIAVSEETKRGLVEMYQVPESKITVIYQSAESRFTSAVSLETKQTIKIKYKLPDGFILNVGSFFPRKNQVRLIEAFAIIKDKVIQDLVLVGSAGDMKEKVKEAIAYYKLTDRIHIIR